MRKELLLLLAGHYVSPMDYDKKKRVFFVCRKECLTCPLAVPNPIEACKYLGTECGCSTHMSIKAHPRLILRWHRASSIHKKIKAIGPHPKEAIPTVRKMIWIS